MTKSANGSKSAAAIQRSSLRPKTAGAAAAGCCGSTMTSPAANDDDRLHRITWDEFFKIFDENDIAFLFDPEGESRFSKFVSKERADS
jgi:hypothetical protein